MNDKDDINLDDIVIDLGDYSTDQNMMSGSGGADTITITGSDYSSINTITLPTPTFSYTNTGAIGATVGGISSNWNTATSYTINGYGSGGNSANVNITNSGIEIDDKCDIKLGNKSLKDFMTKIEQRMAILVPDPEKLEKFEALKKAYEHYKTMEALCFPEPEEDENER